MKPLVVFCFTVIIAWVTYGTQRHRPIKANHPWHVHTVLDESVADVGMACTGETLGVWTHAKTGRTDTNGLFTPPIIDGVVWHCWVSDPNYRQEVTDLRHRVLVAEVVRR